MYEGESSNQEVFQPMKLVEDCEALGTFVEIPSEFDNLASELDGPLLPNTSTAHNLNSQSNSSDDTPQFPDIEKCIPRWKDIFPWVCWCSEDNALYCLHCRELLRKSFPDQIEKSYVVISASEKVFTVAKLLREHYESTSHTLAIYLYSHSALLSFVSLFINHYRDIKSENEVMETVRAMFNYSELTKEGFVKMIINIGQFIETTLINKLKESKYFSVVADQCRGILVLRWVGDTGIIEEHIFWSYLSEWNLTPMQYLKRFGLNLSNMTLYIANTLCQQCSRCQNLSVKPASLPPRPPSILSFAEILWNLDFLRPVMSLVRTVYKLMKVYPYKFAKNFDFVDMKNLYNFNINPSTLIKVMDRFDAIKGIAVEIYETRSYVEALGLAMVNLNNDEKHKKIIFLLQEIIDVVKQASMVEKITDQQIVKLNQALGSLKYHSYGANFVTYEAQNSNEPPNTHTTAHIREFINFVEMFIDENQRSIYYHGRNKIQYFLNLCCLGKVLDATKTKIDEAKLFLYFDIIYDVYIQVLKNNNATQKMRFFNCILHFYIYLLNSGKMVMCCMDIIKIFDGDKNLHVRFPEALEMFLFCATMPFQPCQVARSLFVSFVVEQRLESSVWIKTKENVKPWLLYMQHELSSIPPKELLNWWVQTIR